MNNFEEELKESVKRIKARKARDKKEDEKYWREFKEGLILLLHLFLIAFLNFAEKTLTSLSYIFPFSYLMKNNRFHHSHKGIVSAWSEINELSLRSGTHFDIKRVNVDDYFYHYIGKFDRNKSAKNVSKYVKLLEDKYTKGNVFLGKSVNGLTSININKAK